MLNLSYSYSTVPGIYSSKQTESKGVARGRGLFTAPINLWPPITRSFVFITVNTSVHVQVFTVIIYTQL